VKRAGIASAVGVVLAFLASQHHNLHMLLLSLGLGGAGGSLMQGFPGIRRAMLIVSLVIVAASLVSLRRAGTGHRTLVVVSAVVTTALIAWSVLRIGF
jgi:hypothetical protein